jgi:protein-disulfide isomerase
VAFRLVNQVQPWHPQAYYLSHTLAAANIAIKKKHNSIDDSHAFRIVDKLYEIQDNYSDAKVADRTTTQIYSELKKIVAEAAGNVTEDEIDAVLKDEASVTYVKVQIKYARQNSVHVTPTVAINGLIEPSASSSWDVNEWTKLLDPLLN